MGGLVGTALRKGVAWLTGKFLGEVMASAAVTLILTAAFSGRSHLAEPPVPTPLPALALTPGITAVPSFKVSLQDELLTMAPPSFIIDSAPAAPRRVTLAKAVPVHQSVPVPRPRAAPVSDEPTAQTQPAPEPTVVAAAAPVAWPAPREHRSFTLFGIGPGDLVPSPRHLLSGVASVGHSIAGLASEL